MHYFCQCLVCFYFSVATNMVGINVWYIFLLDVDFLGPNKIEILKYSSLLPMTPNLPYIVVRAQITATLTLHQHSHWSHKARDAEMNRHRELLIYFLLYCFIPSLPFLFRLLISKIIPLVQLNNLLWHGNLSLSETPFAKLFFELLRRFKNFFN